MLFLSIVAGLLLAGVGYQIAGSYLDSRRFRAAGRLVEVAGLRLHLLHQGSGTPTIVLEAGIAGTSLGWAIVQPEIAKFTSVCSYDRAGLGWSGSSGGPRPVNLNRMVLDLKTLLANAEINPPYLLVGHSFGGLLIRAYAHRHPEDVAGLVFVDPVCISTWANAGDRELRRLATAVKLSRRGSVLARIGVVRFALGVLTSGGRWLPKLIGRMAAGKGSSVLERLVGEVRRLPPAALPVLRSHWCNPKNFHAMAKYLECLPESARLAQAMPIPKNIPFTVLSAGNATTVEIAERNSWAQQSERGQHFAVANTGHWIQLERPDVVVKVVHDLISAIGSAPLQYSGPEPSTHSRPGSSVQKDKHGH